ncbi:GGDEF domain-containing protein [Sporosarcina sp. FSL K6-3457]|uniref:GGDEF domain-containing protein n=1 Tax=Sporosarcina sp. FSL K6-3457 TaxID=2978204 RepID=UPI0030FB2D6C
MWKNIETFDDLKRVIYLFLLPSIFIVTVVSFVMQLVNQQYTDVFYINGLFVGAFTIGWLLVYRKQSQRLVEYYLLWLVMVYHVSTITIEIFNNVDTIGMNTLISFSICTPFILILLFLIMDKSSALWLSVLLLVLSIIPGVMVYSRLDSSFFNSLTQLYITTAVYILVIFFLHELFRMRGEIKMMQRQLYLDPFTQIGNRHQIDEWMKKFVGEAQEDGAFSLLFFDIDRFKYVNDQFGHKVGDDVLKEVVRIVQKEIRKDEFFGRWGGEEFIIFLPTREHQAFQIAERLCQTIGQHEFSQVGQVTVSFGVTGYQQGDTAETILVRADELLYASKENGRNRVTGEIMSKFDE